MAFASSLAAFGLKPATQSPGTTSFATAPPLGQNQLQQSTFGTFGQNSQQNQQTTAPASSLFGQPQQQPAPANSFGQPQQQNQQQPAASSLFGQPQQPNQQTTAPGSSLFGQPQQQPGPPSSLFGQPQQQNQQTTAPTSSLFGQPQQQNQSTLPPGSLFGQPQTQTQNPTLLTGNLFGQQQQQPQQQNQGSQPQQNQTLPTGSLFGQPQQQNQQILPPGSLFGQQPQQQQQQPGNIFGGGAFGTSTNTSNIQQPQKSVFGLGSFGANTQQQQQQTQQSLLGSTTTNTTNFLQAQPTLQSGAFGTNTGPSAFGIGANSLFNKSQQPQQQGFGNSTQNTGFSGLGQSSSLTSSSLGMQGPPPFTKSTKFNDLPDNIKKVLEQIDSHIQGRIQISKDLQQRKLGDEATKGNESIRTLRKDLINTTTVIRNDLHLTQDLKAKVDQAVEDTIVATRIIDGFRNPQSGNTYLKDHASFPLEYFTRMADLMKERLACYKATIEQIERKLSSSAASAQTPQGISVTLQVQHGIFLSLASKTAAGDIELQKIKALYTQLWRSKTGSVRDPFNDNVKRSETPSDFGLPRAA